LPIVNLVNCHNSPQQEASPVIVEPLWIELPFLKDQFQEDPLPEVPMADNRTMAELLQAPTEGYEDAIDCFNDLLRACPHYGFSELHQLDTFYNALNDNNQDSLNSATGGNFLDKMPWECLKIIKSKSKVHQSRAKAVVAKVGTSSFTPAVSSEVAELKNLVRALLLDKKNQSSAPVSSSTPAPVKAVEPNYVTCGGSGTLPSNTITNPKEELKGITAQSGVSYQGLTIPTPSKQGTKVTKDQVQTPSSQNRSVSKPIGITKDVSFKVGVFHFPADFVVVDFEPDPRVPLILERCFLKTGRALIDVHKGELTLRIENEAITYTLHQNIRYSTNYNQITTNKIDVIEMACGEYCQEVLGFSDVTTSGNPTPHDDPIVSITSVTPPKWVAAEYGVRGVLLHRSIAQDI
nr:reverse transcriptase domain-containing protein [Tanacetum cinerariifolium]